MGRKLVANVAGDCAGNKQKHFQSTVKYHHTALFPGIVPGANIETAPVSGSRSRKSVPEVKLEFRRTTAGQQPK